MRMIRNLSLSSCWATFLFLLGIGIIGFTSASGPPLLVYKYTKTFQHNFPEIGIWTPIDTNKGYFPLGDLATTSSTHPTETAMMVLDNKDGLVAPPASITEIWRGVKFAVLSLNPPAGYTCIGNVGIYTSDRNFKPDKNNYRCLRSDLLTSGDGTFYYQDNNMSLWNVIPDPSKSRGLATGTFVLSNSPNAKPSTTFVVDSSKATLSPLLVYTYTKSFQPTYPKVALWIPIYYKNNYYPLGDLASSTYFDSSIYPTETAMMVLDNKDGLVAPPASMTEAWRDGNFAVLTLNPPAGYTCLGNVAIYSMTVQRDKNMYRCLRSDLVTPGDSTPYWKSLWNVIPIPSKNGGLATGTFVYSNNPNAKPSTPFVVDSSMATPARPKMIKDALLVYKRAKAYTKTWVFESASFWRPVDFFNRGYYALGDVYMEGNNYPVEKNAIMVQDNDDGLVAPPDSLTLFFAKPELGGAFFVLNPPEGYTCMGIVTIRRSDGLGPDKDQFRCLRSDLVTPGDANFNWNYPASVKSLWDIVPKKLPKAPVLETGLFVMFNTLNTVPAGSQAFVLLMNNTIDTDVKYEALNSKDVSLVLYETAYVDLIWDDREMRGASNVASIWRAKECCSLGDTAVQGYDQFATYMVKDVSPNENALKKPIAFKKIYNNQGSVGWPKTVSIWEPKCASGYVALGYVANPGYDQPSTVATNFRCVDEKIATFGKWNWVYDNQGSGAKTGLSIWRADPATVRGDSVGVWAMSAVNFKGSMSVESPVVLNAAFVSLRFQKPVKSMKITNLIYDMDNKVETSQGPSEITSGARSIVDNCFGNNPVSNTRSVAYSASVEKSWSWATSLEFGISVEYDVGIPLIGGQKTTVSVKASATKSNAASETKTISDTATQYVTTEPGYMDAFYVMGTKYVASIPFIATVVTTYTDDSTTTGKTTGVYADQSISQITFTREKPVYCGPPTTLAPKSG